MYDQREQLYIALSLANLSSAKIFAAVDRLYDAGIAADKFAERKKEVVAILSSDAEPAIAISSELPSQLEALEKGGIKCVTPCSNYYPSLLSHIAEPPANLYCRGDVSVLKSDCFSVVGTRKISAYSKRVTENFAFALAQKFTIVSGLAYGVDSVAHEATLSAKGKTIAVLGGGLDKLYPASNRGLAERIIDSGGLLVSEYPPDADPLAYRFPKRNRIVAGISCGLLVCSAPIKSGTFSTVNFALDEGRDVFVVPGEIYDYNYLGSNKLISSMQGAVVLSPDDILHFYGKDVYYAANNEIKLDIREQKIVDLLSVGKMHFNEIVEKSGFAPVELNTVLANMQLKGLVIKAAGNFYVLNGGME